MSRFDPEPGEPYGTCMCGVTIQTPEAMRAHFDAVSAANGGRPGGSAHSVSITNPTRAERIENALEFEAANAIERAVESVIDDAEQMLKREGVTVAEITAALGSIWAEADWSRAWAEYVEENGLDEDEDGNPPAEPPTPHSQLDGLGI